MSLQQFLIVARARRHVFIAVWVGTLGLVLAATLLLPPRFDATATVVLDMKSSDPIAGIALPGGLLSSYVATQIDVVQSERVAMRAMHALNLQNDAQWRRTWQGATDGRGNFEAWLAERLLKHLQVRPARDSSVLTLSYASPDPEFAANMVNAIVQAYIDIGLELRLEPARRYNRFFDERAKPLRDALEQAQTRLSKFQQDNGLVATDERLDVEYIRLSELTSQVVGLQSSAADARGRQQQARVSPERMDEVLKDPVAAALSAELSVQETRLADLGSRLGDQNPQVLTQRDVVSALRARLTSARLRASGTIQIADSVAQGRLAEQAAMLEKQRAKVLQLKAQRDGAQILQRDVESAQRAYDAVLARASQTALESGDTQASISVLKLATPPPNAAWPKLPLSLAVGLLLGGLLAVAAVLLLETRDYRLRSPEDVTLRLRQPLLAALPRIDRDRSPSDRQNRVVDGLSRGNKLLRS